MFQIKWQNSTYGTYHYGTHFSKQNHEIVFDNPLMTPGRSINKWSSKVSFQDYRRGVDLPLLLPGESYELTLNAVSEPENSIYIKVTYYNRLNEEIGFEMLKGDKHTFLYPKQASFYTIELVNAGCVRLTFSSMTLSKVSFENVVETPADTTIFLFVEPNDEGVVSAFLNNKQRDNVDVVLIAEDPYVSHCYLHPEFESRLETVVAEYATTNTIYFVAYGPYGNLAALYYSSVFKVETFVTTQRLSLDEYVEKVANHYTKERISQLLNDDKNSFIVKSYGVYDSADELVLVQPLWSTPYQLEQLPYFQ